MIQAAVAADNVNPVVLSELALIDVPVGAQMTGAVAPVPLMKIQEPTCMFGREGFPFGWTAH